MSGARRAEPGQTWWGRAWVEALEQRARLDPNRLPRGRDYARGGSVGHLVLAPGEVRAQVQGRKTVPYEVRIRVRRFADDEWDRVLETISAQLGHAAAMLDGELPPEVAADVAAAGLDLLPAAGEVGPRCTCPDDADPCKHSAAVCYLVADALDADPFAVLLLRGRTRGEVLAGLRARRRDARTGSTAAGSTAAESAAARSASAGQSGSAAPDAGVDARTALAAEPPSGPIPVPPMPPARPGHPAALPVDPPAWRGGLREDLLALAADAAARAWELAVGLDADAGLGLDADADLARRAGRALGTPAFAALAARSGVDGRDLARQGLAWQHGGAAGLELLRAEWDPLADAAGAADLLKAARAVLGDVSGTPARATRNRVTAGRLQLRLGRDLLWYPYVRSDGDWEPAGPPKPDPVAAAAEL
ncbi:MAG TPA: SWIM zinc finger family protein [Streptosporangiaceae bacterium]|nr:SWIM zinc finger family protein [Streptosporangiaceae bacterium]